MDYTVLIIITSLVFSAIFSGLEIAFLQSNKLKIELDNKQGILSARILSSFVKRQGKFITALLLGNNVALVIYGIYMGKFIIDTLFPGVDGSSPSAIVILSQTLISTLIILITAEFLPKTIFRINPNKTLSIFAIPLSIIYFILYIPTSITMFISNLILRAFGQKILNEDEINFGKIDLDNYLTDSADRASDEEELDHEIQIFQNALNFSETKARDCMVPRTEIIAIEIDEPIEELNKLFIDTGLSKVLIYRDSIDNIIGYVHSFELFQKPEAIKNIIRTVEIVPETILVDKLLEQFIKNNRSVSVVVDEYGGTSGIITVEDIIEEIFGEIEDEHDSEDEIEEVISDHEYVFSARLEIDYINEKYDLKLPESDEYETLAGFIITNHEDIPSKGEKVSINDFIFIIIEESNNRIDTVRLIIDA